MKVLHLIDSGGFFGAEQMLIDLICAQREQGIDAVLASIAEPSHLPKGIEEKAEQLGLPWQRFDLPNRPCFNSSRCLVNYMRQHHFQLAHTHGYKAAVLLAMMPRWLRKFPVVATVHGYTSRSLNKMYLYQIADRCARRLLQASVYVSGAFKITAGIGGVSASIPNGLGPGLSDWTPDEDLRTYLHQYRVIGSAGRFSPEKGFDLLIEAFAALETNDPQLRLLLIGDGGLRSELEAQIARLGLQDKVWLAGYRDNAGGYIADMHLFVNSSYTEGLPITLLEAMRGGTPIVASAVGGIPDLLEQGELGVLVSPGSVPVLQQGLSRGLLDSAQLLARKAKEKFEAEYRRDVMAKRYTELYQYVLQH